MASSLQHLLDVETHARQIVEAAKDERQRILDEAVATANAMEADFAAGRAELRAPYLKEARERADRAVAELHSKHEEQQRSLREKAALHEREAVAAALRLLLDPEA